MFLNNTWSRLHSVFGAYNLTQNLPDGKRRQLKYELILYRSSSSLIRPISSPSRPRQFFVFFLDMRNSDSVIALRHRRLNVSLFHCDHENLPKNSTQSHGNIISRLHLWRQASDFVSFKIHTIIIREIQKFNTFWNV